MSTHINSDNASPSSALPDIPGFELEAALRRLRGKKDRLIKFLRSFADDNKDASERLSLLLQQQNIEDATRLAHQIKGSGANLGAASLSAKAATIEQLLRSGATYIEPAQIQALADDITRLQDCVVTLENSQATASTEPNTADFCHKLEELANIVDHDLPKSMQLIEGLEANYTSAPFAQIVAQLNQHFIQFDLPALRATLKQAQQQFNTETKQ